MTPDPFAPHLRLADDLFAQGNLVKAGQIWQAILKQDPGHGEARAKLLVVKERLTARRAAEVAAPAPVEARPEPAAEPPPVVDPRATAPEALPPAEQDLRATAQEAPLPSPHALRLAGPEAVSLDPQDPRATAPEALPPTEQDLRATAQEAPLPPALDLRLPVPEAPTASAQDARTTAPEAPAPVEPAHVITGALDPERLLREGCTLYDMGQVEDALKKWEQVLTLEPDHALARGYANGARRELGLPGLAAPAPAPLVQTAPLDEDEDIDKLLREAVQLYDMGLAEEAISKWQRVLALEPQRTEIQGYLAQARAEVAAAGPAQLPVPMQAPGRAQAAPEGLDLKLRQAEHLLNLGRREEAAFTFQQALSLAPGNPRALQGLDRCRKPDGLPEPAPARMAPVLSLDAQGRIPMAVQEAQPEAEPQAVEPPAALQKKAPTPREGLSLPERLRAASERLPWLKKPKLLAAVGGGLVLLVLVAGVIHSYRKDQALKDEIRAAKDAAVGPLAQQSQPVDLAEAPAAIREEAEGTLVTDPLRAYFRAQILVSRNPSDAAAPALLEKARAGLMGGVTGASLPEFQKHLQNGDLEAASRVIDALLRAQPDDTDLRARAARLHLSLCVAHASQGKWELAQEDLLRGRALFPGDKNWQARLRLLDSVKALPKEQRPAWIALLG